jgi:hypothetical protein
MSGCAQCAVLMQEIADLKAQLARAIAPRRNETSLLQLLIERDPERGAMIIERLKRSEQKPGVQRRKPLQNRKI